ncbi:3-Deoxy-D-manno-octulosonate 8-phosphate phosphatase, YrbI family [Elusimicrobium minutum Pei191]|uniref:3-deoxy-D-manno-octulosonate 8-phosphate phosphatase KdsC n=1 Tax=Elusimicrobium minutum (strain Pei191) TaxID=445932 RepID=B2KER4_ELUMP|nr:HAD hydrolase family protein [Elusimicrobium minutum]ACC99010.1 3-Deoxy-D-manno-octulosonate 8-phosphate phosphatase, YrbI family [Elusimicrobium minutum Pei191]
MKDIIERAKKIKMLITDVDGVLTKGEINLFVNEKGETDEVKQFAAVDGLAFMFLWEFNMPSAILTGRSHKTTVARAKDISVKYVYQGFLSKTFPFEEMLAKENLKPEEIVYIGDDIIDLPVLTKVGLAVCPSDGLDCVKECCQYITKAKGGKGCVREIVEIILKAQGKWDGLFERIKTGTWKRKPKIAPQVFTSDGTH